MNGDFIQFNPNGEQLQGHFFISRPGRVRFQYDPPVTVSIIADGKSVLVYDKKLQTYDIWPLSQTPLRLLLDKDLNFATSDKVTRVGVAPDLVEVELHDETRFSAGARLTSSGSGPSPTSRACRRWSRSTMSRSENRLPPTSSKSITKLRPTPPARPRSTET
jgi:hypothetical protein